MTYGVLLLYKTKGNYLFKIKQFAFHVRLKCVAYCVVYTLRHLAWIYWVTTTALLSWIPTIYLSRLGILIPAFASLFCIPSNLRLNTSLTCSLPRLVTCYWLCSSSYIFRLPFQPSSMQSTCITFCNWKILSKLLPEKWMDLSKKSLRCYVWVQIHFLSYLMKLSFNSPKKCICTFVLTK